MPPILTRRHRPDGPRSRPSCTATGGPARPTTARRRASLGLAALTLLPGGAFAQGTDNGREWALCHTHYESAVPPAPAARPGSTVLNADEIRSASKDVLTLSGDVQADRDGQRLQADHAVYDKVSERLEATGNIVYRTRGLTITGETAEMQLDAHSGRLDRARYRLPQRHASGGAATVSVHNRDLTVLERVTYTTCDPDDRDWLLSSSRVELDHAEGVGSASNVVLSFQHIPFFYSPYLSFPIDDRRKSGLLTPSYKDSSESGTEFILPYYLNIAPRFDATLTPRTISRRGTMLMGEFRYLNPASHGQLNLEYLPDDELTEEDRELVHYRHAGRPLPRLRTDLDFRHVSDGDYFRELGNSLSTASVTHLEQSAELAYQGTAWATRARLQKFQTVDESIPESARPYQRLPQISLNSLFPRRHNRLNYALDGEYVNFQRDGRVSGDRLDLQPRVSLPLHSLAAYLTTDLSLRHTAYRLDDPAGGPETTPDRTLPVLSLDSGVFLERDTRWGGRQMLHTLEPRLYYLYIPYRDQSALPRFDTAIPDFNFTRLFRENRFNGPDRVGDANQLSVALTTRFLETDSGRQRLRASIGRIYYLDEREVVLSGPPETAAASDIVAQATVEPLPSLSASLDLRWDRDGRRFDKGGLRLQYRPARRSIVNFTYRYRESILKQTDVSVLWPLGSRWHVIGRHYYSIRDRRNLETLAGLEYQSCCWRFRVVNRRYVNDDAGETNDSLYVQLELKGLTSVGDGLENVLEHGILGYAD